MLLGIDAYSYHWACGHPFRIQTSDYYGLRDYYPRSAETINLEKFLNRCLELGAEGVEIDSCMWSREKDPVGVMRAYADQFKYVNWSEAQSHIGLGEPAERAAQRSIANLKMARDAGATILRLVTGGNCFLKDPSPEEQVRRVKENLLPVVKAAEEIGVVIALENHADHRSWEIVDIIQTIDSPALKANFDVGNPLPVGEDMYEAAERMAPYTITVHFKDWKVMPLTFFGAKIVGAPLGQGVIDLPRILDILEKGVPDPANLRLNVEVMLEAGDEDKAVVESMAYAKRILGR